ncbi:MAG: polysaccharide deacetylase family protein [Bacteroidales bacterium]|nr:polysaccharide deacetylase family protein [Bacteroidales bacterium]
MKAKYGIIIALVLLLIITVVKMMHYEESIREERIITVKVEDETKPLIVEASEEELKRISLIADYYAIASGDYFKVLNKKVENDKKVNVWDELFLKGVNIGVAVPGKFPAEFSLSFQQYLEWFRLIGEMNSNVIRTYTILPPEFYEAFLYYNLNNQSKKLYLLQGVWAKIPDDDNYYNQAYNRDFKKEIINVIDLIHGNALIEAKPGHGHGTYVSNISKYVIGILLGREWEPKAVILTNHENSLDHYSGKFVSMNHGTAMEAWLAKMMDFTVLYETQTYKAQRPISFVNWLPLDPMFHNCEFIESKKVREYDNDLESLDFTKFHPSDLFYPGIYAAYHAYPYYPDFIYLQNNYANAKNKNGQPDNFYAYLNDLKEQNEGLPLIIAEYGLPSSRGNSHYTPLGLNQGGHSEAEQAELSIQLTRDIFDTKCGGAIYFEWIDEWFKHNWLVMDFEQPYDNRKLWHNMENPEQNFGIYAYESRNKTIDGKIDDWNNIKIKKNKTQIKADADPAYFYLTTHIPNFDFDNNNIYIAIDTYDEEKGDHRLPFYEKEIDKGIEFLMEFRSKDDAKILVDDQYSIFTDIYNDYIPVYASKENDNAKFIDQVLLANRKRESLFGKNTDSVLHNRSKLHHGNSSNSTTSNADWFWNDSSDVLELRLTWHLLNVSDPSGRYVLDDKQGTPDIEYTKTEGFNIYLFVSNKNDKIINNLSITEPYFYSWETWDQPEYQARLKEVYFSLKDYFQNLNPPESGEDTHFITQEKFSICNFYENRKGAISLSLDDAGFTQFQFALPELNKYYLKASFGITDNWLHEMPTLFADEGGFKIKRLGINEVNEMIAGGHEISLHGLLHNNYDINSGISNSSEYLKNSKIRLEQRLDTKLRTIHFPHSDFSNSFISAIENSGLLFGRSGLENIGSNQIGNINYNYLKSILITKKFPDQHQLDSIIRQGRDKWTIFSYHHFFPINSNEYNEYKLSENDKYSNCYSIIPDDFKKQIRLIRNSGYWIAPISTIGKYITEKESSEIRTSRYSNLIFLTVINKLDGNIYDQPLTIEFLTKAKKVRVSGSDSDGVYDNRNGNIYFNALPNKEVTIEIID